MKNFLSWWKKYSFVILLIFIILGLFDMRYALVAIICMIGPIILSFFRGRYWCGNICPRGNFYDNIVSKFSRKRNVPKFLKSNLFRAFVVVFMMSMFALGIMKNWGNLYGIGMVFYRMIILTTLVGIVLSFFYNHRTWCHFCPMGTIASVISKYRNKSNSFKNRKLQVSSSCVSCKLCEKKCSLGIVPYDYKGNAIEHPDCIQCGKCITACPKKAIGYNK